MFRLVNGGEHLPQRATQFSAGFDVFANEDVEIMAGETVTVGLGIALDLSGFTPNGCTKCGGSDEVYQDSVVGHYCDECGMQLDDEEAVEFFMSRFYLELHPRSSLRATGIGGGVGIIDMDYRDEIKIVLSNPVQMDAIDIAIRTFQVGLEVSQRDGSELAVNEKMQSFASARREQLGLVSIKRGDKIGQLILKRHDGYLLPANYTVNAERTGGFGSTDA